MMRLTCFGLAVMLLGAWSPSYAMEAMDPELQRKARQAADGGLHYLRGAQLENGSWINSVGVTALALRAFLESRRAYNESDGPFIEKPVKFLLSHVREDGSISESLQNTNYNTATAMYALAATRNPKYAEVIASARDYLRGLQIDEGEEYNREHRFYGGIGYGGDERPDLSNIYYALESLRASGLDGSDPVWEKALLFVSRSQNRSESNDQEWATNDGGFTYMPGYSPHGGTGSYGGMTSVGLISLIYAGADRQDPRVRAAFDWIRNNYTLDENPGTKGKHGLFYYYTAFAKAMYAMGEAEITDGGGATHNWRNELATKLVGMQAEDGSWVNPFSQRWWEGVKDLVTARAVIALNYAAVR